MAKHVNWQFVAILFCFTFGVISYFSQRQRTVLKSINLRGKKAKAIHFRLLASAKFLHWNGSWTLPPSPLQQLLLLWQGHPSSAEVRISASTITFTYCTAVRLSFPLPSTTEHQQYFVRICLQRLSHFTAWTLSTSGISESKCSSFYWKLCTCIHKWDKGRKTA